MQERKDNTKKINKKMIAGNNFLSTILIPATLWFMLAIFEPLVMYMTNMDQFWFDIYDLLPVLAGGFIALTLANSLVLLGILVLRRKMFNICVITEAAVLFCLYVQGNYMSAGLPALDGRSVDWSRYNTELIKSIVLWVVVILIMIISTLKFGLEKMQKAAMYLSAGLILMLGITLVTVFFTKQAWWNKMSVVVSTDNEMDYSKDKNFVIFVVDAVDSKTCMEVINSDDRYEGMFEDFTYYPDTLAAYPFTEYSVPMILGGEWNEGEELTQYSTDNLKNSPFFKTLREKNYSINLYEPYLVYEDKGVYEIDNVIDGRFDVKSGTALVMKELGYSFFKYMPYGLKEPFRKTANSMANISLGNNFMFDNDIFYENLKAEDIKLSDENNFKFIHIDGAHTPFVFNADVESIPEEEGTYEQSIKACMTIVKTYLSKLKEAGVYDNAVIIVMADHGFNGDETEGRQNPLFLVKGINERHEMKINDKPISYEDLLPAYNNLLEGKSGDESFNFVDENRDRKYLFHKYGEESNITEFSLKAGSKAWETEELEKR